MRTLSRRELNRATLARQLLLRRHRLPVARAVERVAGLQAQWPPSPYLALWSRLEGFRRDELARAVERRRVVKTTLMRTTLHLVSADDYLAYAGVFLGRRVATIERNLERYPGDTDVDELARRAAELAAETPRTRPELLRLLGQPRLVVAKRRPWLVWHLLAAKAAFVHGPESSVWRSNTAGARFAPAETWLGARGADGDDAVAHIVRRYFAAFGPATRADATQWTGLPRSALEPGLERISLRRFRDEQGRELLDLPRAPLPPADTHAPVRFLPRWDSLLLAHADRSRVLPEEYRADVIAPGGDVAATFLLDGVVAGTWRLSDGRVEVAPFGPLPRAAGRELADEAARLEAFVSRS